ncbi:MAG: DNA mismatch repair protein MutS [Oscillospiraceae bacterium]|nr:DNA mismatch repair protein MutS [Oscillospiraceae bacterium]
MAELTPAMKQYMDIKSRQSDSLLFFRMGDFYEMFGEDAKVASRELDIALTSRDKNKSDEEKMPMCGVPYHSVEGYIARLISKGYKVAVCEQLEDPSQAKGIVKRDVIRVVTPGAVIDASMLEDGKNNFIASVCTADGETGGAFCDLSTGEFYVTYYTGEEASSRMASDLGTYAPREVMLDSASACDREIGTVLRQLNCLCEQGDDWRYEYTSCVAAVKSRCGADTAAAAGLPSSRAVIMAAGALLGYLEETQKTDLGHIREIKYRDETRFMHLDLTARRNLELCENLRTREKKGTLLSVLDNTFTPMGSRLMRSWIEKPLVDPADINRRLDMVEELKNNQLVRLEVRDCLKKIGDMERLIARVVYGSANCRDLVALSASGAQIPALRSLLAPLASGGVKNIYVNLDELADVRRLIDDAVCDNPPFSLREGGFIRDGYSPEVDRLRSLMKGGRGMVAALEERERERTGIKKLKIGYNKVFGYYIEISKASGDVAPEDYIRKQTLVNCERYITQELKEMESSILTAEERVRALEYEIYTDIRAKVASQVERIQRAAAAVAALDAAVSFATAAADYGYCRPQVDNSDVLEIRDGRHPVVERMLTDSFFVPNNTSISISSSRVQVITGPNMAGKSTYMRQVALITLMAQAGSFVPASRARIGVADRIFTRVGASDDLAGGRSTFMVEMTEVSDILKNATERSLLILDEIGRGTSTFDGMAIARAVLEHAADPKKLGARTLFATHYHELTALEQMMDGVKNYNIAVKKRGDDVIFLRKIVPGGADRSYGIEVAGLAGLPKSVIKRARVLLGELESGVGAPVPAQRRDEPDDQFTLTDMAGSKALDRLRALQPDTLTPLEALGILYELKKELENE